VCWDPVGEFLASQSDDRSVKIWRTTDWGLEAEVRKPFEDSPGSTFFRRLRCAFFSVLLVLELKAFTSWSPDGAHITASNATNNKGFVFIAAVITRNTWTSEISLVGHENTIEVAVSHPSCTYTCGSITFTDSATILTSSFETRTHPSPLQTYALLSPSAQMTDPYPYGKPNRHDHSSWPKKSSTDKLWI
jgi:WD40 repeat protein